MTTVLSLLVMVMNYCLLCAMRSNWFAEQNTAVVVDFDFENTGQVFCSYFLRFVFFEPWRQNLYIVIGNISKLSEDENAKSIAITTFHRQST